MLALGYIGTVGRLEVIAGHDVVDVVDASWPQPNLGEVSWPDSTISVLGLIL